MWRLKKRELVYYNIDYIKAFIKADLKKNQLFKLSKNSNQIFFDYKKQQFCITRMSVTGAYDFLFSISIDNINLWFIWFLWKNRSDFIEITWQCLTIYWVDFYYFLMKKYKLEFVKYKRIDVCFDLALDINYFYEKILDDKYKQVKKSDENKTNLQVFSSKKNGIETIYFWKRNIKENSYIVNRIYNKILDSQKKQKLFLYDDYKNEDWSYKQITRFETELREDLCKFYKYEDLKNEEFLYYRIVKSFYKYNVQFFKFLKDEDFMNFKKSYFDHKKFNLKKIFAGDFVAPMTKSQERIIKQVEAKRLQISYWNDFIDDKDKELCSKMFISYWKRLFKNWFTKEKLKEMIDLF